ncbi:MULTISPECIES: hypothetical protein [unclassified Lentimicrobium]|uniref:hypothetical protein n=1 Tax=unclassified Lentimicrobium TaxID=2677434 RepID=UPI001555EBA8|nr:MULTISPECIES: hypothetical protein [unclassified Lentimicrobium]NPD43942.1 hypothetical protein [Lentimicrobium sp. S6]NPD84157.1 hypothetical protein [Lentimicrobium sp. L6]
MEKARFNSLTQVQKLLLIMESGRLIMEKKEEESIMKLYIYKQFYVEVIYDLDLNKIRKIDTPELGYIVDEYLDVLNIDDILNL